MSQRVVVSKKSKYYISKERRYELQHRCYQYYEWKRRVNELRSTGPKSRPNTSPKVKSCKFSDTTATNAIEICNLLNRIDQVNATVDEVGEELADYIFMCVVDGQSYEKIKARFNIPCCKDNFYELIRKFYWRLDQVVN